jgi:hypothetical protein
MSVIGGASWIESGHGDGTASVAEQGYQRKAGICNISNTNDQRFGFNGIQDLLKDLTSGVIFREGDGSRREAPAH